MFRNVFCRRNLQRFYSMGLRPVRPMVRRFGLISLTSGFAGGLVAQNVFCDAEEKKDYSEETMEEYQHRINVEAGQEALEANSKTAVSKWCKPGGKKGKHEYLAAILQPGYGTTTADGSGPKKLYTKWMVEQLPVHDLNFVECEKFVMGENYGPFGMMFFPRGDASYSGTGVAHLKLKNPNRVPCSVSLDGEWYDWELLQRNETKEGFFVCVFSQKEDLDYHCIKIEVYVDDISLEDTAALSQKFHIPSDLRLGKSNPSCTGASCYGT